MAADLDTLNRLGGDALRDLLSGSPEDVAGVVRAAAEGGSAEAQLMLGQMLLDGTGMDHDAPAALDCFGRAAAAGHAMAMNMVGRCCEHGWGVKVEKPRAAQWYRAAADRGLDWGMYNLATLLALGDGVARDRAGALALFRRAAGLGHAKSMNMVGSFYEDGWVVAQDMGVAADHYRRAAEGGDFRGRFNHARMLIAKGNVAGAERWLRRLPESATSAFVAQVGAWLAAHENDRLRQVAIDLAGTRSYENASQ